MLPEGWTTTKYALVLKVKLDWPKFEDEGPILPPPEFVRCTDWRFEVSADEKTAVFSASWDKRRVKGTGALTAVTEQLKPYIAT